MLDAPRSSVGVRGGGDVNVSEFHRYVSRALRHIEVIIALLSLGIAFPSIELLSNHFRGLIAKI